VVAPVWEDHDRSALAGRIERVVHVAVQVVIGIPAPAVEEDEQRPRLPVARSLRDDRLDLEVLPDRGAPDRERLDLRAVARSLVRGAERQFQACKEQERRGQQGDPPPDPYPL
jgi:hypothetical protein